MQATPKDLASSPIKFRRRRRRHRRRSVSIQCGVLVQTCAIASNIVIIVSAGVVVVVVVDTARGWSGQQRIIMRLPSRSALVNAHHRELVQLTELQ